MMKRLFVVISVLALGGCNDPNAVFSNVRVSPMGPGQYAVSCVDGIGNCARQANKMCPSGYDVSNTTVNPRDYGRMTMIIRCR
jgi:hypothetical protein